MRGIGSVGAAATGQIAGWRRRWERWVDAGERRQSISVDSASQTHYAPGASFMPDGLRDYWLFRGTSLLILWRHLLEDGDLMPIRLPVRRWLEVQMSRSYELAIVWCCVAPAGLRAGDDGDLSHPSYYPSLHQGPMSASRRGVWSL